jgi:tetratricopeptide (TPR) repeat protein
MTTAFLSRFTPSLMAPEDLEALLVHRDETLSRTIGLIADNVDVGAAHHVLLIGPRGIGKTHFVSVLFHRLAANVKLRDRIVVAWLREEEWGVASFLDLLLRILRALPPAVIGDSEKVVASLYSLTAEEAEFRAMQLLLTLVRHKSLILITENLDELFAGLGDDGQKRLRAFLQENPKISLIATAQSLFGGVSRHVSPFYGFFHTHHLAELSLDEATSLLRRIAALQGDEQLGAFLQTPLGRARVRAVHHLAGGNHRIYVILSQFLTRESLDEFVGPLLKTLDDLTPYYQARMAWLSPQQRKITEALCELRRAGTVGELAQRCFITHQTTSSQLRVLRERGYVTARQVGRESYYDLREPLMRLCIEVKRERARPVRLFLDFLRLWYTPAELTRRLETLHSGARLEREYVNLALESGPMGPDPRFASCHSDLRRALKERRYDEALRVAEELVAIRGTPADRVDQAHALIHLGRWQEAEDLCAGVLETSPDHLGALVFRGQALVQMNRADEAVQSFKRATEVAPADTWPWRQLASAYCHLGRHDDELAATVRISEISPEAADAWINRATAAEEAGRDAEAWDAFERLSKSAPERADGWIGQAGILTRQGRSKEAHAALARVTEQMLEEPALIARYARVIRDLGDPQRALGIIDRHLTDKQHVRLYTERSRILQHLDRWAEALRSAEQATETSSDDHAAWHLLGYVQGRLARYGEALGSLRRAQELGDRCGSLYFEVATALAAANCWEDVWGHLREGFQRLSGAGPFKSEASSLMNAAFAKSDPTGWDAGMRGVLEAFERQGATAELSDAVVQAIGALGADSVPVERWHAWLGVWQHLGQGLPVFEVPLRLLGAAIRYRDEPDEKALLELPVEERRVLAPLLGIDRENGSIGEPNIRKHEVTAQNNHSDGDY